MRALAALACALAVLGACATPPAAVEGAPAAEGTLGRGRAVAEAQCARCHAVGLEGASPNAHAPPFRGMTARYSIDALAEGLSRGVLIGHPQMPELHLTQDEVRDLVNYMQSLGGRAPL